jgi:hypothetical protein
VQMHVVVQRRAEAVQEGDGAKPRAVAGAAVCARTSAAICEEAP